MLKAYKTTIYFILAVLSVGMAHSGTVSANSSSHIESNSYSQITSECKPICHSSLASSRSKLEDVKKDEREPIPPQSGLSEVISLNYPESLLADRQIWKLSSWLPPDQLLLSSAYTTSL